jgi:hypothetical protein
MVETNKSQQSQKTITRARRSGEKDNGISGIHLMLSAFKLVRVIFLRCS